MQADDAADKLRTVVTPFVEQSKQMFEPVRERLALHEGAGMQSSLGPIQELAKRMRKNLA